MYSENRATDFENIRKIEMLSTLWTLSFSRSLLLPFLYLFSSLVSLFFFLFFILFGGHENRSSLRSVVGRDRLLL